MKRLLSVIALAACVGCLGDRAFGDIPYFQGFEDDAGGWTAYQQITRVPSGGGVLGLTSAHGSFYAEIQNLRGGYNSAAGLGEAGYTFFGNPVSAYSGDFYQALSVYVDAAHWGPTNGFFWIDNSPRGTNGASDYNDEQHFELRVATSGVVQVNVSFRPPFASISNSAWYTFVETFRRTTNTVQNDFLVYDLEGRLIASTNNVPSSMPSSSLGGNSYLWITYWTNGFAGDILAIDNARTGHLPFNPSLVPKTGTLLQFQ